MSNNGQTIADRLAAARHVIDGSTVNKERISLFILRNTITLSLRNRYVIITV